jgi:hypothetical protein
MNYKALALYGYEDVAPPKNLSHIVYHPFQIMNNVNKNISNI